MNTEDLQIFEAKQKIQNVLSAERDTSRGLIKETILPVSESEAQTLSQATGLCISAKYRHTVDKSGINHALKNHGTAQEMQRGQKQLTKADFLKIPEVIRHYDDVRRLSETGGTPQKNASGNDLIQYRKTFGDGVTYYVEEVRVGKRELAFATMWIRKKRA